FRAFVAQYDATPPKAGDGAHPLITGTGWQSAWDTEVLPKATLIQEIGNCPTWPTWTDDPGDNENLPMTCAKWYEMFLFCLWDGGGLPTEAGGKSAAGGGIANRLYPWGPEAPDATRAVFNCAWSAPAGGTCAFADHAPVGSLPDGESFFGLRDMAGSVWEYT